MIDDRSLTKLRKSPEIRLTSQGHWCSKKINVGLINANELLENNESITA